MLALAGGGLPELAVADILARSSLPLTLIASKGVATLSGSDGSVVTGGPPILRRLASALPSLPLYGRSLFEAAQV